VAFAFVGQQVQSGPHLQLSPQLQPLVHTGQVMVWESESLQRRGEERAEGGGLARAAEMADIPPPAQALPRRRRPVAPVKSCKAAPPQHIRPQRKGSGIRLGLRNQSSKHRLACASPGGLKRTLGGRR
jgi:hypothetical protein